MNFLENIRDRVGAYTTRLAATAGRLNPYALLTVLLALFALWPLFAPGYFFGAHDGRHSVFYVTMFDEAIRDGALWPRWAMHHNAGYGYPTFIVQAPLAFYAAEFFVLLGFGITTAVKLTWAAGFLIGGWGMYWLIRDWEGDESPISNLQSLPALIAALLYIFIPYHLLDMYVRAALAETTLIAWFPWVFLAFERLIVGGRNPGWQKRLLLAALTYAGVILTHVIALIAFTPLLVAFILFRLWTTRKHEEPSRSRLPSRIPPSAFRIFLALLAGVSAILLAAIFLLPLLAEGPLLDQSVYTGNTYEYARHWVQFSQFFDPFWGYGFSDDPVGANDGMGFQVGLMALLLALASGYGLWRERRQRSRPLQIEAFLLVISAAILFLVTPAAAPIWGLLPMVEVIQFPWRLLALSGFTLSALGGLAGARLLASNLLHGNRELLAGGVVLALLVVFASARLATPETLQPVEAWREDGRAVYQFEQQHPDMLGYTQWVEEHFTQSAMTAQYAAPDFSNDKLERLGILSGEGTVLYHYSRGHSFGGEVEMTKPGVVQIRVYFFPGWQVQMDGALVAHRLSPPDGLIEIDVPAGRHRIAMRMGSTPVRTAGIAISGLTLALLVGLAVLGRKNS